MNKRTIFAAILTTVIILALIFTPTATTAQSQGHTFAVDLELMVRKNGMPTMYILYDDGSIEVRQRRDGDRLSEPSWEEE